MLFKTGKPFIEEEEIVSDEEKKILEQKKVEPIKKVKSVVENAKHDPPVDVNKKTVWCRFFTLQNNYV